MHTPKPTLILFHNRMLLLDKGGVLVEPEYVLRTKMNARAVLFICAAILFATGIFGYGRTIWSHAEYYTSDMIRTFTGNGYKPDISSAVTFALEDNMPQTAAENIVASSVLSGTSSNPTAGSHLDFLPEKALIPEIKSISTINKHPIEEVPQYSVIGELSIEKINIRVPILESSDASVKAVNGGLVSGVVLWPDSFPPGEGGTSIILGHSSAPFSYRGKYGVVFSLLPELGAGDPIVVRKNGVIMTYKVRDFVILDPKKEMEDKLKENGDVLLLVSCWPVGTNWQRIVVRADRIPD